MRKIVSGMRPSGKLHIGHMFGTLNNWIKLQAEYECFYFVADWHALTTMFDDVDRLQSDTYDMVVDWLSAGLDPDKCHIFRQSDVPEVAELALYLSMITPISWLERCPTFKEQLQEITGKDIATHGFLGYPVLQAADIIIYGGELVPVGEDQLPHLELSREIVRRFNHFYGNYFKEPEAMLSPVKRLVGIDGRKMSKSYGNAIFLSDPADEIHKKVRNMITDPERIKKTDPGHPDICLVYKLHEIFSGSNLADIRIQCINAERGCVDCKDILSANINSYLTDFRQRRELLLADPGAIHDILEHGASVVRPLAIKAITDIRERMNLKDPYGK